MNTVSITLTYSLTQLLTYRLDFFFFIFTHFYTILHSFTQFYTILHNFTYFTQFYTIPGWSLPVKKYKFSQDGGHTYSQKENGTG